MKRIHIYLTEEQIRALDTEAARTGLKRSEIVRRWLDFTEMCFTMNAMASASTGGKAASQE